MRARRQPFTSLYQAIVELPDRLYPFANKIEGRMVRGKRSYEHALSAAFTDYGPGRFGYKLLLYRETFHFLGAILFITSAGLVSKVFFGSDVALYVLLGAAIIALSFQEFYIQPKRYGQRTQKGVTDMFTWIIPMMAYLFFYTF